MLDIRLQDTRVYQEAKQEGREEGRTEEARSLVLRLLNRRFGELPSVTLAQLNALSRPELEALGEVLFELTTVNDLANWLQMH